MGHTRCVYKCSKPLGNMAKLCCWFCSCFCLLVCSMLLPRVYCTLCFGTISDKADMTLIVICFRTNLTMCAQLCFNAQQYFDSMTAARMRLYTNIFILPLEKPSSSKWTNLYIWIWLLHYLWGTWYFLWALNLEQETRCVHWVYIQEKLVADSRTLRIQWWSRFTTNIYLHSMQIGCKAVTALLQYFFLAAFCWMLCEGIMLYLKLVVVFSSLIKKWWFFFMLGWGMLNPDRYPASFFLITPTDYTMSRWQHLSLVPRLPFQLSVACSMGKAETESWKGSLGTRLATSLSLK